MNRVDIEKFENEIIELIRSVLFDYADIFKKEEMIFKLNKIKILNNIIENYKSEVAINFYNASEGLCDVVEFFLFKEGHPVTSLSEIEIWLRESFDDVLNRQRNRGD